MCCLGTAVMAGVGDAYTTTVIPAKAGIQRGGATGRRSFFELGCERLERMGRMGDGRDGTAVMVGVSDACTTTVIPAKAGIQRGGATGRRSFFEIQDAKRSLNPLGRMGNGPPCTCGEGGGCSDACTTFVIPAKAGIAW